MSLQDWRVASGFWELALLSHKAQIFKSLSIFQRTADRQLNVASEQRSQEMNFSMKQKSN